jgi:hypothetical protein
MRKRFEQQLTLGVVPIGEVKLEERSRHQLPPLLKALQYVFVTPELNSKVFTLLEDRVLSGKQKTGRLGMSLWEILVLSLVRLNLDIDYDFLLDQANNHIALRGILGVDRSDFKPGKEYKDQTLRDNVGLLDEQTLRQINELIVEHSHGLIKKNEGVEVLALHIKMDSYVVETNVHFPTDLNLLWDSGRKSLATIEHLLSSGLALSGWGKRKLWGNHLKNTYRSASEIHRKKGANYVPRLKQAVQSYLLRARQISGKVHQSLAEGVAACANGQLSVLQFGLLKCLEYYLGMLDKHIDLVDRRLLQGQTIPHEEKVFSIFEPHTEWISKGKLHRRVELGHNVAIATDQYHFIIDFETMFGIRDAAVGMLMGKRLVESYGTYCTLDSISFDRGFYSSLTKKALARDFDQVIMPKKGTKTAAEQEQESAADFQQLRRAHSAVESNINQLEHNGLNRCPDKGERGFRRYVALGILSYNLHRLGKMLLQIEQDQARPRRSAA